MTKGFYNVSPALVPPLHLKPCVHILLATEHRCEILFLITRNEKRRAEDMKGTRVWCLLTVQQEELGLSDRPVSLPCRQSVHHRAGRGVRTHGAEVGRRKHGPLQVSLAGHAERQPALVPVITWRRERNDGEVNPGVFMN